MSNTAFRTIRGLDANIENLPIVDGYLYYAYDSGKIYLDKDDTRVLMSGGGGAANGGSIYFGEYGQAIEATIEVEAVSGAQSSYYYYPLDKLEEIYAEQKVEPRENDLILDIAGALYRIIAITDTQYKCTLLPLSGSGGGASVIRPSLVLHKIENSIIINGQPFEFSFTAKSALDEKGDLWSQELTVYWSLIDADTEQVYYTGIPVTVDHDTPYTLAIGDYLKESTDTIISLYATALNHDEKSATRRASVSTVEMYLEQTSTYNPAYTYSASDVTLSCNAVGNLSKILEWTVDGKVLFTEVLTANSDNRRSFKIPSEYSTHGYHSIEVNLYQNLGDSSNPVKGLPATPLIYEIAAVKKGDNTQLPIIWLGDYQSTYYNYDIIQIPFLVYNPADTSQVEVHLCKNDIEIDGSPLTIQNFDSWNYWQIADADLNKMNYYSISCGLTDETTVTREILFTVEKDLFRDMTVVQQDNIKLNFNPVGRTNSEAPAKRASWSYTDSLGNTTEGKFENFNWYNNGWGIDSATKDTYLRISNGAKFTIPFGALKFGTSGASEQSHTIEMVLKVRNVQNYSNLITNITRYVNDEAWYTAFTAETQTDYTNYDAYLQATLTPDEYEELEFSKVQKNINLANVACGYYSASGSNAIGICVGPQDTFFSNGSDTVNVSFVENEMVHLSFVYDHSLKLLFIYINGVITGVIESTVGDNGFTINSTDFVFDSAICDIDLYKLRVYNTALGVNGIVTNYAVDKKDTFIYDQNGLALDNAALKEYQLNYNKVLDYNKEHPSTPLMPYIVFDTTTTNDDKLPYAKANGTTKIRVEFVNVPLDTAYARGELIQKAIDDGLITSTETNQNTIEEAVRTYYKHHCPSWTSTMSANDIVTIEVQGTSSEFYPRRNFKIKTKKGGECCWGTIANEDGTTYQGWTEEECLNIFMHKGPYEEIFEEDQKKLATNEHYYGYEESRMFDGWYMNNYTNPTDRWTMKVDYMESSGSYNAGFASLMGTAYTKHPLEDYYNEGVLSEAEKLKNDVFNDLRWEDYRTSLLGFPVMAFQKRKSSSSSTGYEYLFIGYYRMLLDKGSDQVLGFKAPKKITTKLVLDSNGKERRLRDVAECWEFSTNARTFCSYRDPWKRVEFSFKAPVSIGDEGFIKLASGNIGGPAVLNHFEPRYFEFEDYLKNDEDGFYNFGDLDQKTVTKICEKLKIDTIDITASDAKYKAQDAAVNLMGNWEKVCKWIYSTDLANVKSQGNYTAVPVGLVEYAANTFYVIDEENKETGYSLADGDFDPTQTYYTKSTYTETDSETGEEVEYDKYENAYATLSDYIYQANTFYIKVSEAYSLDTSSEFDSSQTYYIFETYSDEQIAKIADLLVAPATEWDSSTIYYTYNSDAEYVSGGGKTAAVTEIGTLTEEDFNAGSYYVASPVQFVTNGTIYKYDTKEYRTAKFVNQLADHFDLEYLATYFIMTEVFECYDSRGKNCMMASWGPLEEGGEYIWYPIFYDIDTQLGINNTGIPSFEFNVDATEAGNYSTSDSILWNNFYKFFKGSAILNKYKNLRGQASTFDSLDNPPLASVENLEKWYTFNYEVTKNIADKGVRPLIATNLDMYWKYITITNPSAILQGVAYIPGADGVYSIDEDGTYFYALQGDRSQSRQQFLTNRIEYIDSWLNQGNYARGGNNRIRGRISANSETNGTTSDQWIETDSNPYWASGTEFGTKTHDFDAEYWLTLKPIRSSYVTAGDDSANYPSEKYDGTNAVKFKLKDIESGIRRSSNYPEQLVYIYGMNQMADFGDMNLLYWTEFYMEGEANHLTRLQLGYDGFSKTDPNVKWYNKKLNGIKLTSMPLLKEANFSNIGLQTETSLNLTASEKLENFRAVGTSKLINVSFADGVALNTLYLPESITSLSLTQANLLNNLIATSEAPTPTYDADTKITTNPTAGLYLDGFFEDDSSDGSIVFSSSIASINLNGGSLGLYSYQLLKRFYEAIEAKKAADTTNTLVYKVTMQDVNWSNYKQLTDGSVYDSEATYYIDNGHYGLDTWTHSENDFSSLVINGKLFALETGPAVTVGDEFVEMFSEGLRNESNWGDASSDQANPIISGIVYVNNTSNVEESWVRNTLQPMYPNLTFFFAKVQKAFSAEFVFRNPETNIDEYVKFANGSSEPSVQKISQSAYATNTSIFFTSPFTLYKPERVHYDFKGWSLNPDADPDGDEIFTADTWSNQTLNSTVFDYKYFAIFEIHQYTITFYADADGTEVFDEKVIAYGTEGIPEPDGVPYADDSELDLYSTYSFIGYTDTPLTGKVTDLSIVMVRGNAEYYPVFKEVNVYENIHPEYFSASSYTCESGAKGVRLSLIKEITGKITIPTMYNDQIVVALDSTFSSTTTSEGAPYNGLGYNLTHVFFEPDTQIDTFTAHCFANIPARTATLQYVEFPSSLRKLASNAFRWANGLDYGVVLNDPEKYATAVIGGENITSIETGCFLAAFKEKTISELKIGPSVQLMGGGCFKNTNLAFNYVSIGNSEEASQLSINVEYTPDPYFGDASIEIYFYSDYFDDTQADTLNAYFSSDCALTII